MLGNRAADVVQDDLDVVAIGAGPANLSLAALASSVRELRLLVLEAQAAMRWHAGLLPADAKLQVSPLKDLVTLVDPTNPYSFLNFLACHGRLYRALIAHRTSVSRHEFAQYYDWVAGTLPSVRMNAQVTEISHDGERFIVDTVHGRYRSLHVVCGIGQRPAVPDFAQVHLGGTLLHSSRYSEMVKDLGGLRVLVVGGGQSAGEIFLDILSGYVGHPSQVTWLTARSGYRPLDDSSFSNELFSPRYTEFFLRLGASARRRLLAADVLASDGISEDLLAQIYARLYANDYVSGTPVRYELMTSTRLAGVEPLASGYLARAESALTGAQAEVHADIVILATGYRSVIPEFLGRLVAGGDFGDDNPGINDDYSLRLDGIKPGKLFVQNGARSTHGIADPNLGIMPWRSAVIINSVLEREHFVTSRGDSAETFTFPHFPGGSDEP